MRARVGPDRVDVVESVRPWGAFRQYALNHACTVKVISVAPGGTLSLQRHVHRDELWVVLDAGLVAEIGEETIEAEAGDELFIPRGVTHRLSAPVNGGRILEVAFGDFDEDDIERLDDVYGRASL